MKCPCKRCRVWTVALFTWLIGIIFLYAQTKDSNHFFDQTSDNKNTQNFKAYSGNRSTPSATHFINRRSNFQQKQDVKQTIINGVTPSDNHFMNGISNSQQKLSGLPREALINETQTIFVFKPVHWLNDWVGPTRWETSQVFKNCPVSNCVLSKKNGYIDKADAVIFRAIDANKCREKTKRGQIWIIMEHEAPFSYGDFGDCHRNIFNWTWTYRRDSDFVLVHGQFTKSSGYDDKAIETLIKSKKNAIVGFISHCGSKSKRDGYIKKLRSYGIDIDVYGTCGNLKCNTKGDRWKAIWNSTSNVKDGNHCFDVLDTRYKFYLSFENSLCTDYVTEKSFHLILRHNIVPIIRDASNHTLYHPPKSYIKTSDFKDIASLAARIKQLFAKDDEYTRYFHWRKHYASESIAGVLQTEFCNMCQRLHQPLKYQRVYDDVGQFLRTRSKGSPVCHAVSDIK